MSYFSWIGLQLLALAALLSNHAMPTSAAPVEILLKAPSGGLVRGYTGAIYWNTRRVVVEPPVQAVIEGPAFLRVICGFQLHQRRDTGGVDTPAPPVEIRMRDPTKGTGHFYVKDSADLSAYGRNDTSARPSGGAYFDFDISAFDCDSPMHQSARVPVLLRVEEYEEPVFSQAGYSARVAQTAEVGAEVLRVTAWEAHESAKVCRYEIDEIGESGLLPLPFDIDGAGVIRLKTPFTPTGKDQQYHFSVTASDCSVPESRKASVPVSIVAYPGAGDGLSASSKQPEKCSVNWLDIPSKLAYAASSGVRRFAESAALPVTCGSGAAARTCSQTSAVVKITVQSTASGETCDRSVHSLYDQRRVCHIKPASIDLMNPYYKPDHTPAASSPPPPPAAPAPCKCCKAAAAARKEPRTLALNKAAAPGDVPSLHEHKTFDGVERYVDVPPSLLQPEGGVLGDQFTLHFWLRHGPMPSDSPKEQILCGADEVQRNRHHYSLFLHNCKLILLLRREFQAGLSTDELHPAEWRYKLAEVCDSRWHHYAISYSGGNVKLDVDGKIFAHSSGNPQVLEDYPLHRTKNASIRVTIGACWHSVDSSYRQFLKGALAGIVLLRGELESDNSIHCLNQCHEKLDFRTNSQLAPGMSVSLNADYTMIEIKGHNTDEVARMLRQIGYVNLRKRMNSDAKSAIRLDTGVTCADPKLSVSVDPVTIDVQPLPPAAPAAAPAAVANPAADSSLCISGRNLIRFESGELASPGGVAFLEGLEIAGSGPSSEKLDVCMMRTSPDFTAVESLIWPAGDASDLGIEGRVTANQLILEGYATAAVYQRLLSRVSYANKNAIIAYRIFVLTCSVAGGGLVSNEFSVKLSILQSPQPVPAAASSGDGGRKHTVKKQLPDPPVLPAQPKASGLLISLNTHSLGKKNKVGEIPASSDSRDTDDNMPAHFAESHVQRAHSDSQHQQLLPMPAAAGRVADQRPSTPSSAPAAPIAIGLATAGLLIVALGLMYLRYRRSTRSTSGGHGASGSGERKLPSDAESQAEMEWDNSALNITVNPLDHEADNTQPDYPSEPELENDSTLSDSGDVLFDQQSNLIPHETAV